MGQTLDSLLPQLRLEVDKAVRRLCSGKLGAGAAGAGGFSSPDYAWILRAYLVRAWDGTIGVQSTWLLTHSNTHATSQTLDDHGVRLNSKPRSAVNASTIYEPTGEAEDSLAVGIVPIAPTVDRGGIPGLGERIQRFTAMELDYCVKSAIIHAILAASAQPKSPSTVTASTGAHARMPITASTDGRFRNST